MNREIIPKKFYIDHQKQTEIFVPEDVIDELKYDKKIWESVFPPNKNMKKLQLTNIGKYSIANPAIIALLDKTLKTTMRILNVKNKSSLTFTETNGGLGGFSIKLLQCFNNLNIVEIIETHCNMIKNNIKQFGYMDGKKGKNIKIYNDDYLEVLYKLDQDIIICDPPWGGTDYGARGRLRLGLNNIDITHVINRLHKEGKFRAFILLCMKNFDFEFFRENIEASFIVVKDIKGPDEIRRTTRHYFIIIYADE